MTILIYNSFVMNILQDKKFISCRNKGLSKTEGEGVPYIIFRYRIVPSSRKYSAEQAADPQIIASSPAH